MSEEAQYPFYQVTAIISKTDPYQVTTKYTETFLIKAKSPEGMNAAIEEHLKEMSQITGHTYEIKSKNITKWLECRY